jgi:pimeloyl-ACP methyl ester carboxylesterase
LERYLDQDVQAFLRYLDFPGTEPAVVYLAGLGLAATAMYPRIVVEPGLSDRRSILVDLFGCGYSDRPKPYSYSLEEHAATLSRFLEYTGAGQSVLVAHSLGGSVAIELASRRPDRVVQIILAEAKLEAGGGLWSSSIADQTENDFVESGYGKALEELRNAALSGYPIAAIILGMWQAASPLAIHRSAVSLVRGTEPIMWDQLIRLSIPRTYLFWGQSLFEHVEDREMYTRLEAHGIRVDVVPDAGHAMMIENPKGFAKAVEKAIRLAGPRSYHQRL